jgi:hypothetical protein
MEKYDVSYRLEPGDASLVAQQVPQVRPRLPWLPEDTHPPGLRRLALVCLMDEAPPGLIPWMIVRTHRHSYVTEAVGKAHRHHWQKGMFLRYKTHGEAMLELREREFHIYAEALWPEFFMKILRDTLQKLITDNWPGLKGRYQFAVPCPERRFEKACKGRFKIDALRQFLEDGDETTRCDTCYKRHNIVNLLYGFEEQDSREQLNRIESKLDGVESRLASYVLTIMRAIASESKDGPRLFTLARADGVLGYFTRRYRIQLWCEAEGCQHPVFDADAGIYETNATREWVKKVAPYANFIAGVLKTLLPMVAPAVNIYFGAKTIDELGIKDHLDLMKEATKKIEGHLTISKPSRLREGVLTGDERSGVLALHSMLHDLDPNHERLGLTRLPTYTGDYLWLCRKHYEQAQPKIPDRIG